MAFRPVKPTRVADDVLQQIKCSIERGDFKIGDKLPGERDLAEQFSVNRAGVREALRVLEAVGMVEVRPGLGCYAVSATARGDTTSMVAPWVAEHRDDILAILDVRESLAAKAAALAAERATAEDIDAIEVALEDMRRAATDPEIALSAPVRLDARFVDAMAVAGKNAYVIQLLRDFSFTVDADRYALLAFPNRLALSVIEHGEILDAIKGGDPRGASEAVVRHIDKLREAIRTLGAGEEDRG